MVFRSLLFIVSICLLACSTSDSARNQRTVDDIFNEGKAAFDEGDWLTAQTQFDVIKLQYPASSYSDDVQYLLAEIFYARSEYMQAAFNYAMVRRSYPTSEYAKPALFKSAECYYQLAPTADRDPDYTRKAIAAFNEFQSIYPMDSLAVKSADMIRELRDRLAEKDILVASQYLTMQTRKSALIYFDAVIDTYPDSKWVEDAFIGKLRIYLQQQKFDDARGVISAYRRIVKNPKQQQAIDALEQDIK